MELVGEPEPKRPRVEIEPPQCWFCHDTIFPCEYYVESWCQPKAHFTHYGCFWKLCDPKPPERCGVCRQRDPGYASIVEARRACGQSDNDEDWERLEDLEPLGKKLLQLLARGAITERQLYTFSEVSQRVLGTWSEHRRRRFTWDGS